MENNGWRIYHNLQHNKVVGLVGGIETTPAVTPSCTAISWSTGFIAPCMPASTGCHWRWRQVLAAQAGTRCCNRCWTANCYQDLSPRREWWACDFGLRFAARSLNCLRVGRLPATGGRRKWLGRWQWCFKETDDYNGKAMCMSCHSLLPWKVQPYWQPIATSRPILQGSKDVLPIQSGFPQPRPK